MIVNDYCCINCWSCGNYFYPAWLFDMEKQKISLLHEYHYDKVSEEDKEVFCALTGKGVLIIGIGMIITAVIVAITDSPWSFIVFAIGFVIGMRKIVCAEYRYNKF